MIVRKLCCRGCSGFGFGSGKAFSVAVEFAVPVIPLDSLEGFIAFGAIDLLGFFAVCHDCSP
jgi:hypothetical protein